VLVLHLCSVLAWARWWWHVRAGAVDGHAMVHWDGLELRARRVLRIEELWWWMAVGGDGSRHALLQVLRGERRRLEGRRRVGLLLLLLRLHHGPLHDHVRVLWVDGHELVGRRWSARRHHELLSGDGRDGRGRVWLLLLSVAIVLLVLLLLLLVVRRRFLLGVGGL